LGPKSPHHGGTGEKRRVPKGSPVPPGGDWAAGGFKGTKGGGRAGGKPFKTG